MSPQWRATGVLWPIWATAAFAGFSSLVYELAWFRLLGLMLGGAVYSFSVMLIAFLSGIAIGGKWGGVLADRWMKNGGFARVIKGLIGVELGIAILSYGAMYIFQEIPFWYVYLFDFIGGDEGTNRVWFLGFVIAGLVMTAPAVLMGIAFPLGVRLLVRNEDKLSAPVGFFYAANSGGAVLGAALAGFVFLPILKLHGTIFLGNLFNILAAIVLFRILPGRPLRRLQGVGALILLACLLFVGSRKPPWDPLLMTAGMYHYVTSFSDHSRDGIYSYAVEKYELLYYEEGLSTVVTVAKNRGSGSIWLANNGKIDASTNTDMPTQVLCAILPMQFVENPTEVLVIGLASGITAGAVTLIDSVERLDVVELEPAILEAARYFNDYNYNILGDPRTNLIANDGRNHVMLAPESSYDVIVSEPSNPWISGVSNLFTKEFFELGKSRLKPGGVWSQWVQLYGMDEADLRSLLATFSSVYPYVLMYTTIETADLVLVGSESPISPTIDAANGLVQKNPRLMEELRAVQVEETMDLVALYQMDAETIKGLIGGISLNTDDNMRIEYSAPRHLHEMTWEENRRVVMRHSSIPKEAIGDDPLAWADLARVYLRKEDSIRAISAMLHAALILPEGDPLRREFIEQAQRWQEEYH